MLRTLQRIRVVVVSAQAMALCQLLVFLSLLAAPSVAIAQDAGPPPDAAVIAGVEVPSSGPLVIERAINRGVDGDTMAMVVGLVLGAGLLLRTSVPKLTANRIVGWTLNIVLTSGGVFFVYLAEDLELDLSVALDIIKGTFLVAGGWQAAKPFVEKTPVLNRAMTDPPKTARA